MSYKEPEAMREIHDIRLKLYEEEKGLSAIEQAKKTNKTAEEIIKKYKLKVRLLRRVKGSKQVVQTASSA